MLYILFGEDSFSISEALYKLKEQIGPHEILESNISTHTASAISLDELISRCSTVPFLSEKRLIIVTDLLKLFENQRKNRSSNRRRDNSAKTWLPLVDYIPHLPDTTDLVLIDGALSGANILLKSLYESGHVMEFRPLNGTGLNKWIQKRASSKGSDITPEATKLLANLMGGNLWALDSEIEKLSLYANGNAIGGQDVYALVSFTKDMSIFDIVDSIIEGNHANAIRFIQNITDESPQRIIEMIARQVRLCLLVKEMQQDGIRGHSLKERVGISSDFLLRKIIGQSKGYTKESLLRVHKGLLEADISIKTGGIQGHMLGQFLVEVSLSSKREMLGPVNHIPAHGISKTR